MLRDLYDLNKKAFRFRYPNTADGLNFPSPNEALLLDSHPDISHPKSLIPKDWKQTSGIKSRAIIALDLPCLFSLYAEIAGDSSIGLIVIEPDWRNLALAFSTEDYRELILSPYVFWIVGENWSDSLASFITKQGIFHLTPQEFHIIPSPSESSQKKDQIEQAQYVLSSSIRASRIAFQKKGDALRRAVPASLKNNRLRIWAHIESKATVYKGLTRSFMDALARRGCEIHLSNYQEEWLAQGKITSELVNFSPDALFFLNGPSPHILRYLGVDRFFPQSLPCRRLTWYVDSPRYLSLPDEARRDYSVDDIAVADSAFLDEFELDRCRSAFHLPPAAMIDRRGNYDSSLDFPAVYVGSIIDMRPYLEKLSASARGVLLELVREKRKQPAIANDLLIQNAGLSTTQLDELTQCALRYNQERLQKRFPNADRTLEYFIYVVTTFISRWEAVEALLPLGLHIFGPDDWLPLLGDRYQDRHHGIMEWERLPDCYASARINLNAHSAQCPTSFNVRDFDVLRAGGFLLTDWVEDVEKGYLEEGKDFCIYRNIEDLQNKVMHYTNHADEREAIAEQGCEQVRRYHTADQRAETIVNVLQ